MHFLWGIRTLHSSMGECSLAYCPVSASHWRWLPQKIWSKIKSKMALDVWQYFIDACVNFPVYAWPYHEIDIAITDKILNVRNRENLDTLNHVFVPFTHVHLWTLLSASLPTYTTSGDSTENSANWFPKSLAGRISWAIAGNIKMQSSIPLSRFLPDMPLIKLSVESQPYRAFDAQ